MSKTLPDLHEFSSRVNSVFALRYARLYYVDALLTYLFGTGLIAVAISLVTSVGPERH